MNRDNIWFAIRYLNYIFMASCAFIICDFNISKYLIFWLAMAILSNIYIDNFYKDKIDQTKKYYVDLLKEKEKK